MQALSSFSQIKILESIQSREHAELIHGPGSGRLCTALGTVLLCGAAAWLGRSAGR